MDDRASPGPTRKRRAFGRGNGRLRKYTRAIRRGYPKLGEQLLAQQEDAKTKALADIARTQRSLRRAGVLKALAWVGLLACAAAITCVAR